MVKKPRPSPIRPNMKAQADARQQMKVEQGLAPPDVSVGLPSPDHVRPQPVLSVTPVPPFDQYQQQQAQLTNPDAQNTEGVTADSAFELALQSDQRTLEAQRRYRTPLASGGMGQGGPLPEGKPVTSTSPASDTEMASAVDATRARLERLNGTRPDSWMYDAHIASKVQGTSDAPVTTNEQPFVPPDGSYADYWRSRTFNSPGQPSFDPNKPTATRDQFGEWSVSDTNDAKDKWSPDELESIFAAPARPQKYDDRYDESMKNRYDGIQNDIALDGLTRPHFDQIAQQNPVAAANGQMIGDTWRTVKALPPPPAPTPKTKSKGTDQNAVGLPGGKAYPSVGAMIEDVAGGAANVANELLGIKPAKGAEQAQAITQQQALDFLTGAHQLPPPSTMGPLDAAWRAWSAAVDAGVQATPEISIPIPFGHAPLTLKTGAPVGALAKGAGYVATHPAEDLANVVDAIGNVAPGVYGAVKSALDGIDGVTSSIAGYAGDKTGIQFLKDYAQGGLGLPETDAIFGAPKTAAGNVSRSVVEFLAGFTETASTAADAAVAAFIDGQHYYGQARGECLGAAIADGALVEIDPTQPIAPGDCVAFTIKSDGAGRWAEFFGRAGPNVSGGIKVYLCTLDDCLFLGQLNPPIIGMIPVANVQSAHRVVQVLGGAGTLSSEDLKSLARLACFKRGEPIDPIGPEWRPPLQ